MNLIRGDRDTKDKQLKKLKTANDNLKEKLAKLESLNDQMNLKFEQSFQVIKSTNSAIPGTGV